MYEYYKPKLKRTKDEHSKLIRARVLNVMRSIIEKHPTVKSRKAFSEAIHTGQATVSRWEANRGMPTIENLADICEVFGISPAFLLMGQGMPWGEAELKIRMDMLETKVAEIEKYLNIKIEVNKKRKTKAKR